MTVDPEQLAMSAAIERADYLRRSAWAVGGPRGHREWLHFSIGTEALTLLVNMSVADDLRHGARSGSERGRALVLVRHRGGWLGDVDEARIDAMHVVGGSLSASLGRCAVDFRDGVFHLTGSLEKKPIAFDLLLEPESFPSVANNVALGPDEEPIHWVVVPKSSASGWVQVDDVRHELFRAPAYHDHNWGYFTHRDFGWQWGHAFPIARANPYSFVFTRLLNAGQTACHMQAALLWKGARQHRVMRETELSVRTNGFMIQKPYTIPASGRLLAHGAAADIPETLEIEARGSGDVLVGRFRADDVARIVVPNDHDLGSTLIHEVVGRFRLDGWVRGEPVELEGHGVFEYLGRA